MKNLMAALAAAQKSIGHIAPDRRNSFANYDYVSAQKMVAECKKALLAAGLVASIGSAGVTFDDNGNITVGANFTLEHCDSGESRLYNYTMPLVKDKKPDDKIVLGVRTTLLRYWLRDLLMIPCDDREDIDARPDRQERAANRSKQPAKAPETLGTAFARKLIDKMQEAGLGMDALRTDIGAPDGSPDTWPKSLGPKVKEWVEKTAQPAVAS
jgi:hypothetical protein